MENNVGDLRHCEEQLRSTLYCDDKEKLRRKLALLQREYLKTAQRLQRAERLDAVRRHVRSRITRQNHQDQTDQEVTSNLNLNPSSLTLGTTNVSAQGVTQCEGHTEGPADSDYSKRSQVIRFLLPSDAACPQTPDPRPKEVRGHRPSPAMRLRSRRSRLRWEKRSSPAGSMTENSEEGQEQSEKMETNRTDGETEKIKSEETEIVCESEQLFSASESEKFHACQEQRQKQIELEDEGKKESSTLKCCNPAINNEEREKDCTLNGKTGEIEWGENGDNTEGESEIRLCKKTVNTDTEQNEAEIKHNEKEHCDKTLETKEERSGMEGEKKSLGLLESCTVVEGLLFPAEYYVRTTRRMTSSQTRDDIARRGRSRALNGNTRTNEPTHTDLYPPTAPSGDTSKPSHLQGADASTEPTSNSQSSSEISDQLFDSQAKADAFSSPTVCISRSTRGRRRKRGRGRGRPQTPRSFPSLDTNNLALQQTLDNSHPISIPASPSLSADKPTSSLISQDVLPVQNGQEPLSCSTATHPISIPASPSLSADKPTSSLISQDVLPVQNGEETLSCSTATHPSSGAQSNPQSEKVYPIFLKKGTKANRSTQMSKSNLNSIHFLSYRHQLALSPLSSASPAQPSLRPFSFQSPGSLINNLMNFDIHQDFHLPDDQFASLKLHKLRQVALESGVESFTSPSYNTRNRKRHSEVRCSSSNEPVTPLPLPLSLTPTITDSPVSEDKEATTQSVHLSNLSTDLKSANQPLAEGSCEQVTTETKGQQQTEKPNSKTHTSSTECVSVVEHCVADCVILEKEHENLNLNSRNSSRISTSNTHTSKPQPYSNLVDKTAGTVKDSVKEDSDELKIKPHASEEQVGSVSDVPLFKEQISKTSQSEHNSTETLSVDLPLHETPKQMSYNCTAAESYNDAPGDSTAMRLNVTSLVSESATTSPVRNTSVETKDPEKRLTHHNLHSQLLQRLTPHPAFPLTSSPSAPSLTLPPPPCSPSIQTLSPPALSPCPSFTSLASSLPPASPSSQKQSSLDAPGTADHCRRVESPPCPTASSIQLQGSGGLVDPKIEETANEHMLTRTYTLEAPAGGCLVDACCLTGTSGGLFLAAAGKWAVCLWGQSSTFEWSLIHSWTFDEPVINVFPVPDAAGLMCVTLGQLEIREVRMLSCSSLSHVLLCKGLIQAVVGAYKSKVVTSSLSATGSTLEVFNVSNSSSLQSSQPLLSPGVSVGFLAPVDGLPDALIGTDECGSLFIWNLMTGQLLQRVLIGQDLSHTSCLRGYSCCGVLFVLLQNQQLITLNREENVNKVEKNKSALFCLVAVNPLNGKSVVATKLYPPKAWSGRLCEAEVNSSSVVGLSENGHVCVWELGHQVNSRMVWAPESEGWQLARWGGPDVLVTGHHNGDVTLHCYSQNSLCL
ncbi:hypothetical protein Q5P01_025510 [Channa striata]|uniref:Partner and localiser of BRCA2 WD40 domain-containing protein n=1 Tax=Channa striata TaxID=64152 RepID=A0AA88LI97_CHASR|nr:hypothetical protein Q5P01_025510 [Channa striata]